MGLDMYLYRVLKSERLNGFVYDRAKDDGFECEQIVSAEEYKVFPKEYKKYFVKGAVLDRVVQLDKLLKEILGKFKEEAVQRTGSRNCAKLCEYMFSVSKDAVAELPVGEQVLEEVENMTVAYEFDDNRKDGKYNLYIRFKEGYAGAVVNYTGKYITKEKRVVYSAKFVEVAYQRKGLNDTGWSLLPENCSYCTDKDVVTNLCNVGGLSCEFIDEWVDNETIFWAWW